MEKIKDILKNILEENTDKTAMYKRNLLKEYLQVFVLDYIYSSKYQNLVFYGGSCLAHLYSLPRLSEDLDLVDIAQDIDINLLAADLGEYFLKNTDLKTEIKVQKFRIYLKFPILKEMRLSSAGETDILQLKIEIFKDFDFCSGYAVQIKPLFKLNKSLLVKTFDLPTMMSTKIRAVLYRKWEKTNKKGETLLNVKGRDYYDLLWYLEKGVKPNFDCLEVKDKAVLKKMLLENIKKADAKSIRLDLDNFIADKNFVKNLCQHIKDILSAGVERL